MILYNITINIDRSVEREWLTWMRQEHVPEIMATGLPTGHKILRLLTEIENGGVTYTFQFSFNALPDYLAYQAEYSDALLEKINQRYLNKYVSFRSLLEEV